MSEYGPVLSKELEESIRAALEQIGYKELEIQNYIDKVNGKPRHLLVWDLDE